MAMESSSPEAMIEEDDDDTQQCHQQHSPGFTSGPGPSAINCSKFGPGIKIDKETLSVSYSGKGQHQNDVGAVQSDVPAPSQAHTYYFEVEILSKGSKGHIGVGYSNKHFKPTSHVGWYQGSYGYHGSDGKACHESTTGDDYGPCFTSGDVIGAGYCLESREIFFTKNGENLGVAFQNVQKQLFPTVGLHSEGEAVRFNFGAAPFCFNIKDYIQEQKDLREREVDLAQVHVADVHEIVGEYLEYYGFGNTLAAYNRAMRARKDSSPRDDDAEENGTSAPLTTPLQQRTELRHLVMAGEIDAVLEILQSQYPGCVEDESNGVSFAVQCQRFLELVRKDELEEAVAFAQEHLGRLNRTSVAQEMALQRVLSSIAYADVVDSPVADMFEQSRREYVADIINRSLFHRYSPAKDEDEDGDGDKDENEDEDEEEEQRGDRRNDSSTVTAREREQRLHSHSSAENGSSPSSRVRSSSRSVLESLLRQLVATTRAIREVNENQGEIFCLDSELR